MSKWLHLAAQSTLKGSLARPPKGATRPLWPQPVAQRHVVRLAGVGHGLAVPVGGQRRADATAGLADDRDGQPAGRPLDVADADGRSRGRSPRRPGRGGSRDPWSRRRRARSSSRSRARTPRPREGAHEELAHEVARVARRRCCPAARARVPGARPCSARPRRASGAPASPWGPGRPRRTGSGWGDRPAEERGGWRRGGPRRGASRCARCPRASSSR